MKKKLGDFSGSAGSVLPAGDYKLQAVEIKVIGSTASGFPYVVVDWAVINKCESAGENTEMGFSLSPNSESIARAWLLALGLSEEDEIPIDDAEDLEALLKGKCIGAIVTATLTTEKNNKGYDQNSVTPPWEIYPAEATDEDTILKADGGAERPDWAK